MENIDTNFLQKCIYTFNLKCYKFQFSKIQVWTYNQMEIFMVLPINDEFSFRQRLGDKPMRPVRPAQVAHLAN